jgi:hypothetical protein
LKAATTNRYVYNGSAGNFVEKVAPTAKKSTSRAAVTIELEKSYFFGSTLVKVYPFGWYLGFSESKSKFRSPTKGTLIQTLPRKNNLKVVVSKTKNLSKFRSL